jgi:hypothetical protein
MVHTKPNQRAIMKINPNIKDNFIPNPHSERR